MVGAELFAAMHLRFDALYPSRDHRPFGGLHVLAFGDFFQFEPVMARSLTVPSEQPVERAPEPEVDAAHDGDSMRVDGEPQQQQQKKRASKRKERPAVSRTRTDANIGRDQWLAFDSVFFLVQQMRQSGDASFLNVLQDLRNCIVSQRVIEYLGSRRADVVLGQHPGQLDDWSDQVLITGQNSVRDAWNSMAAAKHARRLGLQPDEIFDLECVDLVRKPSTTGPLLWRQLVIESSGQSQSDQRMLNFAKLLPSSKTDHIPSTLKLFAGARVIVTRNINTPRGIVNGVIGRVEGFATDANNGIDAVIIRPNRDLGRIPKLPGIPDGCFPLRREITSFRLKNKVAGTSKTIHRA
ncbi:hypothetical protein H9P43_006829 [Blastocladiella emersonii ATCC 22665]|nr:hypothetical protein H9P43_006819 [Blastocladiella emersonii ATCC 22665]KAI9175468.1 hypothetical protein H9P43_006829 [Blastocladiella emersonii ATCC 22665]